MKTLFCKIFYRNKNFLWTFCWLTFCILLFTGCVSEYERIDRAILKPNLEPNEYCKAGIHTMPQFTAEQVFLVRPLHVVKRAGSGENAIENESIVILFPDGERTFSVIDHIRKLKQLWESGAFRIIAYDSGPMEHYNPFQHKPDAYYLRAYAIEHGIPLAILYETDSEASVRSGISQGGAAVSAMSDMRKTVFLKIESGKND